MFSRGYRTRGTQTSRRSTDGEAPTSEKSAAELVMTVESARKETIANQRVGSSSGMVKRVDRILAEEVLRQFMNEVR